MKKTTILFLVMLITFQASNLQAKTTAGIIGPTETLYWDSAKACNGYTLFGAKGVSYLIDMKGRLVHTWNGIGQNPRLLDYNGHILDASKSDPKGFVEMDWVGNVVWSYSESRTDYAPHHDWIRIFNKKLNAYTTIYIANKTVPSDSALAHGADPADGPYAGSQMDALVEVDSAGKVVWEWWFFNHLIQDLDSTKLDYVGSGKTISDYPNRLNINLPGRPVRKDWLHCNSLDYNQTLGQLVTNSVQGEFYIIDHDGTFIPGNPDSSILLAASSKGDFLYRFGDPARYEQGDPPSIMEDWTKVTSGHKQIGGSHDIHWIAEGLPGAGNLMLFNNGEYLLEQTPQSYAFEINPYIDSTGNSTIVYVNPPNAGYTKWTAPDRNQMKSTKNLSKQVSWVYYTKNSDNLYSTIGSSAGRLSNGNTLICAMTSGHIVEVTYGDSGDGGSLNGDPQIVWEYICPITGDGIRDSIDDQYPMYNSIFRAYRYTADFPAFGGHILVPGGTIAGRLKGTADVLLNNGVSSIGKSLEMNITKQNQNVQLRISNVTTQTDVSIYGMNGKLVHQWSGLSGKNLVLNSKQLSTGVYICRIKSGKQRYEIPIQMFSR